MVNFLRKVVANVLCKQTNFAAFISINPFNTPFFMRRTFIIICFMVVCGSNLLALTQIPLSVGTSYVDPIPSGHGPSRTPMSIPNISLDENTLYFYNVDYDLTLVLLDEDGEETYTTFVPAGTTAVVLPSTLSGEYELQLLPGGSFYFYTVIQL